jgi:hypothetical protein
MIKEEEKITNLHQRGTTLHHLENTPHTTIEISSSNEIKEITEMIQTEEITETILVKDHHLNEISLHQGLSNRPVVTHAKQDHMTIDNLNLQMIATIIKTNKTLTTVIPSMPT